MEANQRWVPIESNPSVIAEYLQALGFPMSQYQVADILSTESWALDMLPGSLSAVLLLYPITPVSDAHHSSFTPDSTSSVYHLKQLISNACGTIALIHIAANLRENEITGTSTPLTGFFHRFLSQTDSLSSEERGQILVSNPDLFSEIELAHRHAASQGVSHAVDRVNTHFIAFVPKQGCIFQLDGRKTGPINHGKYEGQFGSRVLEVIQREFIQRDPEQVQFAMLGVTRNES